MVLFSLQSQPSGHMKYWPRPTPSFVSSNNGSGVGEELPECSSFLWVPAEAALHFPDAPVGSREVWCQCCVHGWKGYTDSEQEIQSCRFTHRRLGLPISHGMQERLTTHLFFKAPVLSLQYCGGHPFLCTIDNLWFPCRVLHIARAVHLQGMITPIISLSMNWDQGHCFWPSQIVNLQPLPFGAMSPVCVCTVILISTLTAL